MWCPHCGSQNRETAKMCAACGRSLGKSGGGMSGAAKGSARAVAVSLPARPDIGAPARTTEDIVMRTYLRLATFLIILLLLVGVGAYAAVEAANGILLGGDASALARRVCHDLTSQGYDDLTSLVDPTPTFNATDAWSAAVVRTQLRQADKISGQVTSCSADPITRDATGSHAVLHLDRANSRALTIDLWITQQHDGTWLISRRTALTPGL